MSRLKDSLRSDLTDAIRSRDQVRADTLRMVLTSVTNEEVAGTEARQLSDDEVLKVEAYLPAQLENDEIEALVAEAVAETGATAMPQLGLVMKTVQPRVAGRADGGRVAAIVRKVLAAKG
jgi:uncharacterized protein YqeY